MAFCKRFLCLLCLVVPVLLLQACGGGDPDGWDSFQPRPATPGDLAKRRFMFTGFDYGAVFDSTLNRTTTTLEFGEQRATPVITFDFKLSTSAGAATGIAKLESDRLTLDFSGIDPALPFSLGVPLQFRVLADVDDGWISLTNLASGTEATSAK